MTLPLAFLILSFVFVIPANAEQNDTEKSSNFSESVVFQEEDVVQEDAEEPEANGEHQTESEQDVHGWGGNLSVLQIITLLVLLSAAFLYINIHYIRLPSTIGLMILAMIMSFILIVGGFLFPDLKGAITSIMTDFDFSEVLFDVMLSFLLFAGALEINLNKLAEKMGSADPCYRGSPDLYRSSGHDHVLRISNVRTGG